MREKSPIGYSNDELKDIKAKLEDENYQLKRQLRQKEADAGKNQAVLEQQVQLLTLQLDEAKEREQNMKKVQDKMFYAFGSGDKQPLSSELSKDLQKIQEMHQNELEDIKNHHQQIVKSLERSLDESNSTIQTQELKIKSQEEQSKDLRNEYENFKVESNLKLKELEMRLKQYEDENKRMQSEIEVTQIKLQQNITYFSNEQQKMNNERSKSQSKLNCSLNTSAQRQKTKNQKDIEVEIDKLRTNHDQYIISLKQNYEKERLLMESQLSKLEQAFKLEKLKNESSSKINVQDLQSKYLKEIQELNTSLTMFKKQTEEDISLAKKEREEAVKKSEQIEKDNQNLKAKLKKSIEDYQRISKNKVQERQNENGEKEKLQQEVAKVRQKLIQYKAQFQKMELAEKKMKNMLIEKESEHEQEMIELKRMVNAEKRKAKELQDTSINFKSTYDRHQEDILSQVKEKEQRINMMNETIKNLKQALLNQQQQEKKQQKYMDLSPEAHKEILLPSQSHNQTQQDPLGLPIETQQNIMLATKILEMGQEVTCSQCNQKLTIQKFVKHIQNSSCAQLFTQVGQSKQSTLFNYHNHQLNYDSNSSSAYVSQNCSLDKMMMQNIVYPEFNSVKNQHQKENLHQAMNLSQAVIDKLENQSQNKSQHQQQQKIIQGIQKGGASIKNTYENESASDNDDENTKKKIQQMFDSNLSSVQYIPSQSEEGVVMVGGINSSTDYYSSSQDQKVEYLENLLGPNSVNSLVGKQFLIDVKQNIDQQERQIQQITQQLDEARQERERLQLDLDKTILELKRTKIELALSEERKTESEQCYKNEIKYLIDKLLKTKSKLNKERQAREEEQLDSVLLQKTQDQNEEIFDDNESFSQSFISQKLNQSSMNYLKQALKRGDNTQQNKNTNSNQRFDISMEFNRPPSQQQQNYPIKATNRNTLINQSSQSTSKLLNYSQHQCIPQRRQSTNINANRSRVMKELEQNIPQSKQRQNVNKSLLIQSKENLQNYKNIDAFDQICDQQHFKSTMEMDNNQKSIKDLDHLSMIQQPISSSSSNNLNKFKISSTAKSNLHKITSHKLLADNNKQLNQVQSQAAFNAGSSFINRPHSKCSHQQQRMQIPMNISTYMNKNSEESVQQQQRIPQKTMNKADFLSRQQIKQYNFSTSSDELDCQVSDTFQESPSVNMECD